MNSRVTTGYMRWFGLPGIDGLCMREKEINYWQGRRMGESKCIIASSAQARVPTVLIREERNVRRLSMNGRATTPTTSPLQSSGNRR